MNNCKNCLNPLKSNRGKSGLCQPCSARTMMNHRYAQSRYYKLLAPDLKTWLVDQANRNNLRLSEVVMAIIKDAYFEDKKI